MICEISCSLSHIFCLFYTLTLFVMCLSVFHANKRFYSRVISLPEGNDLDCCTDTLTASVRMRDSLLEKRCTGD